MKLKVTVDKDVCIGSATCIVLASEYFNLNDDGKAEVKPSPKSKTTAYEMELDVNDSGKKKLLAAVRACPTQAIRIIDEKGKAIS